MTTTRHIPPHALEAVRVLKERSALNWVMELQDNGRLAVLHTPAPSKGEAYLWDQVGGLAGHKTEFTVFQAREFVDEDSQRAVFEAVRVWFGHTAEDVAA